MVSTSYGAPQQYDFNTPRSSEAWKPWVFVVDNYLRALRQNELVSISSHLALYGYRTMYGRMLAHAKCRPKTRARSNYHGF